MALRLSMKINPGVNPKEIENELGRKIEGFEYAKNVLSIMWKIYGKS